MRKVEPKVEEEKAENIKGLNEDLVQRMEALGESLQNARREMKAPEKYPKKNDLK